MTRATVVLIAASLGLAVACTETKSGAKAMTREQIIDIARKDAAAKYRDLSTFTVAVEEKDGVWHVRFEPQPGLNAGGPVYVIDAHGTVVSKKYFQ